MKASLKEVSALACLRPHHSLLSYPGSQACVCASTYVPHRHLLGELCVQIENSRVSLVIKNLPAKAGDARDTGSIPGSDDPLEKGIAPHSSILA